MGRPKGSKNFKAPKAAMTRFEQSVDKTALQMFLSEHEMGSKYETFFAMLADPAYARSSMTTLAKKAHVSLQDLQQIYTDGMRHLGLLQMMNQLPAIMADVAQDALSKDVVCSRCDGVGFVPFGEGETRTCPVCEGSLKNRQVGDKHARDLVFQSAKLTGQTGPLVAIQNNFELGDTRMESLMKRTREIVLDKPVPQIIEVKNGSDQD